MIKIGIIITPVHEGLGAEKLIDASTINCRISVVYYGTKFMWQKEKNNLITLNFLFSIRYNVDSFQHRIQTPLEEYFDAT